MTLTRLLTALVIPLALLTAPTFAATAANTETEQAGITLQQLQQTLAAHELVKGDFEQVRNLSMFSQPLSSSGHFVLSRQQGLWWQQTQPFPVSLVLTKNKLSQQFGTEAPQLMNADENPMVFYFSHLFLSLFQGDTQKLQEQFDVALSGDADNWTLALTPRTPPLTQVFTSIVLKGDENLDKLELTELRGDSTRISFTDQSHPSTLTQEEQSVFAL
ncbi:outer membrane lipoprotein carrier protein LolA [Shewanella corallii]|uniref:Outer membrane lipoprotein carrier protein LolA n=1 Tax=Shewanella corallii TaxID=560080 RepID=A0ABT0ND93_9GAMM|nr:outer membrane lipoprotein carrier protein LolA [Shewanella corallii]MCL2916436.1 outer membrane lipoprotein carrier protein LolA [Shewanella corallii]